MWSLRVPALLISATLTASSAVLQLQGDNFQSHLETHSPVLVNCSEPCRNLKPEFEAAAEVLKKRDIACISIDCSLENKTCIANHITSYPTIRIFHGPEKFTRYRNERKAPNIISYMIRDSLPLVLEVTTDNIEEVLLMGTSTLIAYIDEDDQKSRSVFTSFAEAHQNEFIYGITSNLTLAKSNVQKAPFVIVYSPLDQVNPIFKDTFSLDKLEAFANKYSTPLIGTFSLETYYAYTEALPPSSPCTPSDHSSLLSLLKPIAEKHKSKLNFATIDATKYRFFAKALNLATDKFPAFVIEDTVSGDTAPFDQDEEVTGQKIEGFVQKYFELRGKGNVPVQTAVSFPFGMETLTDHCM
ncbi:uncharacterized protein K444DRAFT_527855 [Hyaloscypha bicolor E]|uniref:Protein disulfide-isomerase n=1 Tax=Hyaloscypha bicolor E TaxID=1095630 RepID=A0A2J6TC37_9HELO|nr:uncharacterized protein K444DRAFT_527855 [Hyaloscypha bicolor E]PMD60594.1 hypothetical protein K444DRAFT_527855 [Hyaloscypha bicolor E]